MPVEIKNFDETQYNHEFISKLYDRGFFYRNYRDKRWKNLNMARLLHEYFGFSSVVDFGCGIGSYIEIFKSRGCEVKGFEYGFEAAKEFYDMVGLTKDEIAFGDVTKKIALEKKYDAALCIEVAEHIPTSKSNMLVSNLTNATDDLIIFSAAKIGQGGTGHINCQNKEFWTDLFDEQGWYLQDIRGLLSTMNPTHSSDFIHNSKNHVWEWVFNNLMVLSK